MVAAFGAMLVFYVFSRFEKASDPVVKLLGYAILIAAAAGFIFVMVTSAWLAVTCEPRVMAYVYGVTEVCYGSAPPRGQSSSFIGTLIPGHDPSPPTRCPRLPDALMIYFDDDHVAVTRKFPHTVVKIQNKDILTVNRNENGQISINLYVYSEDGRPIATIINNYFELNSNNFLRMEQTADRTALAVYDPQKTKVLDIKYINEAAVRILGNFRYGRNVISVDEKEMKIDTPTSSGTMTGGCSVDTVEGDLVLSG